MKLNRPTLIAFILLIIVASLYRVWDGRPYGFTPQIAIAIFAGSMVKDKRLAFLFPLLSMFLSDLLYHALYLAGMSEIKGLYAGMFENYLLIAGLTCFGFLLRKPNLLRVTAFSISGSMLFFLSSNFLVWAGGGGLYRPKTFEGLLMCYGDGLAFYRDYGLISGFAGNLFIGDLFFAAILFGSFYLVSKKSFSGVAA